MTNSNKDPINSRVQMKPNRRLINFVNSLMYETPSGQRFTQDSPILPNVWLNYALNPREQQRLILTLHREKGGGRAAYELREMLTRLRDKVEIPIERERARISYIPGQIAAELYFDEMMRVALPLTRWWSDTYDSMIRLQDKYGQEKKANVADWVGFPQPTDERIVDLTDGLIYMRRQILEEAPTSSTHQVRGNSLGHLPALRKKYIRRIPVDFLWLVRLAGVIGRAFLNGYSLLSNEDEPGLAIERGFLSRGLYQAEDDSYWPPAEDSPQPDPREISTQISSSFSKIYSHWCPPKKQPEDYYIWRVTQNRPFQMAVMKSALTVKADAARRLFDISSRGITWAVIDSGIDQDHPAFKQTTAQVELNHGPEDDSENDRPMEDPITRLGSRVVRTLDFTNLRELLDFDIRADYGDDEEGEPLGTTEEYEELVNTLTRRMLKPADLEAGITEEDPSRARNSARRRIDRLRDRIRRRRDIDWEDLQPLIVDRNPESPPNDHGTHVAGILGADWIDDHLGEERDLPLAARTRRMQGVCPDINLIDVRVFREDGMSAEFELLAALQYLRWINSRAGYMVCHGVNLSLSLIHEVRRFACGQTPICDECNEAVAAGLVVVAAAGNRGFEFEDMNQLSASDGYRPVSITDPGNATNVITVGATHRKRPYEYGVSYFSSRGPTGDGRMKPDLVAPGEKIKGPTPDRSEEFKDGTSMAAPHVSGAAAMLMARHSELVGDPRRIKQILCETATDLHRERYYQGHGLLDILRALQSV